MANPLSGGGIVAEEQFFTRVAAGESIFRESEPGTEMYIIQEGQVEILKESDAQERRLAVLEEGDFFGEMAILEDMPRTAGARALTPCALLRIDRSTFNQLIRHNPEISVRMLRKLCHRLRETNPLLLDTDVQKVGAAQAAAPVAQPAPQVEVPASEPAPAAPASAVLVHPETGAEFVLEPKAEIIIGRYDPVTGVHPDLDLKPMDNNRSTSRRHSTIMWKNGRFKIREDVGCANGTFVNGKRTPTGVEVDLFDGDAVQFGLVKMVFKQG